MERNRGYCMECDSMVSYKVVEEEKTQTVKGKSYTFIGLTAVCPICNQKVAVQGLEDKNIELFDQCYRKQEGIITIHEIKSILDKYNIKVNPLSKVLGFGDITITRYLDGQIPSKKNSNILYSVLNEPKEMKKYLLQNKSAITDIAYIKAMNKIDELLTFKMQERKIEVVANYILSKSNDITPLALQKLLYYCQAFSLSLRNTALFSDDCQAWLHGPVYPDIYNKYKKYSYNIIDAPHNITLSEQLSEEEYQLIDHVIDTFGLYSGKVLEILTHFEEPWAHARSGISTIEYSDNIIEKDEIQKYFKNLNMTYDLNENQEIIKYIESLISM